MPAVKDVKRACSQGSAPESSKWSKIPQHARKSTQSRPHLWQLLEILIKQVDAVIQQVRQELQVDAATPLLLRQCLPLSPAASQLPSHLDLHGYLLVVKAE